jgi:hypothetical protein
MKLTTLVFTAFVVTLGYVSAERPEGGDPNEPTGCGPALGQTTHLCKADVPYYECVSVFTLIRHA